MKPDQVLLGCGSSEVLRVAVDAWVGQGRKFIQAEPTFEVCGRHARLSGAEVISVSLDHDFAHDLDRMLERADNSTGLIYICNPNNPTASITPRKDLETFIAKLPATTIVLIDEAYHHFAEESAGYASFLDRPIDDQRVIVARTFSKVYGLAGVRIGYGIATPKLVENLARFLTADNMNQIGVHAAATALHDTDSVREFIRRNSVVRQEFVNQAKTRGLKVIPSHANFAMLDTRQTVEQVIQHFRRNGTLIGRRFPPMDTHIRVSFGTPDEMQQFWRVWDLLPSNRNASARASRQRDQQESSRMLPRSA